MALQDLQLVLETLKMKTLQTALQTTTLQCTPRPGALLDLHPWTQCTPESCTPGSSAPIVSMHPWICTSGPCTLSDPMHTSIQCTPDPTLLQDPVHSLWWCTLGSCECQVQNTRDTSEHKILTPHSPSRLAAVF